MVTIGNMGLEETIEGKTRGNDRGPAMTILA